MNLLAGGLFDASRQNFGVPAGKKKNPLALLDDDGGGENGGEGYVHTATLRFGGADLREPRVASIDLFFVPGARSSMWCGVA